MADMNIMWCYWWQNSTIKKPLHNNLPYLVWWSWPSMHNSWHTVWEHGHPSPMFLLQVLVFDGCGQFHLQWSHYAHRPPSPLPSPPLPSLHIKKCIVTTSSFEVYTMTPTLGGNLRGLAADLCVSMGVTNQWVISSCLPVPHLWRHTGCYHCQWPEEHSQKLSHSQTTDHWYQNETITLGTSVVNMFNNSSSQVPRQRTVTKVTVLANFYSLLWGQWSKLTFWRERAKAAAILPP